MTAKPSLEFSYEDAEHVQLMAGVRATTAEKIAFFEEMIEIAWRSGALTPERLALRDQVRQELASEG